MHGFADQVQSNVQYGRAAAATIELGFQWIEEPTEHKRQRLQPLDGPFKIERLLEAFLLDDGKKRPRILTTGQTLPPHALLPQPRGDSSGG